MLTCALIVWVLIPNDWNYIDLRETYLTNAECKKKEYTKKNYCLKIDKRRSLTNKEWLKDNCNLSEHKWIGDKIELEKYIK